MLLNTILSLLALLSRKRRGQSLRTTGAEETTKTFGRMITKAKPLKVWSDKGTEFKEAFGKFCESKGIEFTLTAQILKRNGHLQSAIFDLSKTLYTIIREQVVLSLH